jgi:hypothetical protein
MSAHCTCDVGAASTLAGGEKQVRARALGLDLSDSGQVGCWTYPPVETSGGETS